MLEIGDFLKTQRKRHGLTLRQVEEKTGISNSYLSQVERGKRTPSPDVLGRLAPVYGIAVSELWARAGLKPGNYFHDQNRYELDRDDAYRQVLREVVDDDPEILAGPTFQNVPGELKKALVTLYQEKTGKELLTTEPRYFVRIEHSHRPEFASFRVKDQELQGNVLVSTRMLARLQGPEYVEILRRHKLNVEIRGEDFFDLGDVLKVKEEVEAYVEEQLQVWRKEFERKTPEQHLQGLKGELAQRKSREDEEGAGA